MPNTLKAGDDITDSVLGLPSWTALSLLNSWTNQGAPQSLAQWRFIPLMNAIEVTGSIQNGTITDGTIIASGLTPAPITTLYQGVSVQNGSAPTQTPVMYLDTAGNLKIQSIPSGTTKINFRLWFPLDS